MSVSEKQLLANKANAKHSTGPKTEAGKEVARLNAVKHGLRAATVVIDSPRFKEDPAEYESLLNSLYEELAPRTPLETHLVQRIANCLWRSRRINIAEMGCINNQLDSLDPAGIYIPGYGVEKKEDPFYDGPSEKKEIPLEAKTRALISKININSIPNRVLYSDLLVFEMRLDRQLTRLLNLLKRLKNRRNCKPGKKIREKPLKMGPPEI
jgi:hypothetical protein